MTTPTPPPPAYVLNTTYVYRSTDGGTTWQLLTTILPEDSFARNGVADTYQMIAAPDTSNAAMLGMAGGTPGLEGNLDIQQFVWMSGDVGQNWTKNVNWAEPYYNEGWSLAGPGGLTAFPGSRPVVPTFEALRSPQVTIVG